MFDYIYKIRFCSGEIYHKVIKNKASRKNYNVEIRQLASLLSEEIFQNDKRTNNVLVKWAKKKTPNNSKKSLNSKSWMKRCPTHYKIPNYIYTYTYTISNH